MLSEARSKLDMADFLMQKDDAYLPGAMNHILQAALIAVKALTKIDDKTAGSPQLVKNALSRMKQAESDEFATDFRELWKLSSKRHLNNSDVSKAHKKVKSFVMWVEEELIEDEGQKNLGRETST